ncbi:MAG: response regulator [Bacteroides sp.]|nr:response regulator [Bacteroides sp.]
MQKSILIAEDHPVFLQGMISILKAEQMLKVVGTAKDGIEAVTYNKKLQPDLVLMDVNMPKMDGMEATRQILVDNPQAKILAVSNHSESRFIQGMLKAGARGYLLKDSAPEEILLAIREILQGKMYLSSAITKTALSNPEEEKEKALPNVLLTKLFRPQLSVQYVQRTSIIQKLEKNRERPFSLVSAGAGYGKSITVSQWLSHTKALHSWISLDEEHNDLRSFLSYIKAAVESVFPGKLKSIGAIVQGGALPALSLISTTLINELEEITHPYILVMDDFHYIHNQEILSLIDTLIQYPPQHFHLCMLTRRDPLLKLYKLRAQNKITEIRMADLAFSENEIKDLAKQLRSLELDDEIAKALHHKTEGWVIGICLNLLGAQEDYQAEKLFENMEGDFDPSSSFLIEEVLSKQPKWIEELLMFTSLLNRFSAELVQEIIQSQASSEEINHSGSEFIEQVTRSNLFIIPLDHEKEWHRYHHLFQELLQKQLKEKHKEKTISSIHLLAASWFEKQGFIEESIYHALACEDQERAAQIIERNRENAVNNDHWYVLDKWLDMLPESFILTRPDLLMARSWVLLHHFLFEEVFEKMVQIENLCGNREEFNSILGEVALFRGYILFFMGDGETSLKHLETALEKIPLPYFEARAQSEVIYALSSQMVGRKDYALSFLDDLFANPHPSNDVRTSRLLTTYVFIHILSGDFVHAAKANEKLFKVVKDRFAYNEAWSIHLQGVIHLYEFDLNVAAEKLQQSVKRRYIHFTRAAVDSICALMLARQAMGNEESANQALKTLREFIAPLHDPAYDTFLQTAEIRLYLLQGRLEEAVIKRKSVTLPPAEPAMIWWIEIPSISYCRALIAEGSTDSLSEAGTKLDVLLKQCLNNHNTFHLIELLVLKATTCSKLKQHDAARSAINEALEMASPGGIIFPFIEAGDEVKKLLVLSENKKLSSFINKIQKQDNTTANFSSLSPNQLLSKREMEVLQHTTEDLRNKEIAALLYISEDTVKKHLYNIFQKLGVNNRYELIKKAKALGLLR